MPSLQGFRNIRGSPRLVRRLAYAAAALTLGFVFLTPTKEERVLGQPEDFARLEPAPFRAPIYRGSLESTALTETSGLAASQLREDLLWVVNDGGNDPVLHAIGADGRDRGSVRVEGAKNRDWEDVASFLWRDGDGGASEGEAKGSEERARGARSYILIADIGDNNARRKRVTLYGIPEPIPPGERFPEGSVVRVAWRQRFRFDDGPRDAEGIAVDVAAGQILVVSKRSVPAAVYSLALPPPPLRSALVETFDDQVAVAQRIALLSTIPRPTQADVDEDERHGANRSQATAFDIAPDGSSAVVLSYKHAYYYAREGQESWAVALGRDPRRLAIPPMAQAEAGAFSRKGNSFFVTSEQRPAPLFQIPRQ